MVTWVRPGFSDLSDQKELLSSLTFRSLYALILDGRAESFVIPALASPIY